MAKYAHLSEKTEFSFKCKRPDGYKIMSPADIPKIEFSMKSVLLKRDTAKRRNSVGKSGVKPSLLTQASQPATVMEKYDKG